MNAYVFLVRRPLIDNQAWPVTLTDFKLASDYPDRVSPVAVVVLNEGRSARAIADDVIAEAARLP